MPSKSASRSFRAALWGAFCAVAAGCGDQGSPPAGADTQDTNAARADSGLADAAADTQGGHDTGSDMDAARDTGDLSLEARVAALVGAMTLEEKVSQMGHVAPAVERLDVPAYNWWNEALHGVARSGIATVFPQAIALAGTFDPALVQEVAAVISTEARVMNNVKGKGLTYWSPTVNLARDPRWGRNEETYGEDPYLASRMAVAFVRGMQGDDPVYLKTVATPKHFIANNEEHRRHTGSSEVDERSLREFYMPAFKAAVVEGGAFSIMCAYNALNGVPACANEWLLSDVLRDEWGFQGYVVSDCWAIRDIVEGHKYVSTDLAATDVAMAAGTDLNCGTWYQPNLVAAVAEGLVTEGEIDTAVTRLFTARFKLGEFDPDSAVPYRDIPSEALDSDAHRALALTTAQKSMVLLKNDGLLPISPAELESIAVIGPNANRTVFGGYSGEASSPTTPLDGIRGALAGFGARVDFHQGTAVNGTSDGHDPEGAALVAAAAQVAVVVVGIDLSLANEELDRASLDLPPNQQALLEAVYAANPNTVAVLVTGAPLSITWADEHLPAILNAWYGGQSAGEAIADILFGHVSPSGRLPQTFYRSVEDLPAFDDYDIIEGKRTYMFFDQPVLYPFGHGLGYTRFEYRDLSITPETAAPGDTLTIAFDIENIGDMAGDEVAQVYVRDMDASAPVAIQQLEAFARVSLAPGETRTVSVAVAVSDLGFFDTATGRFAVEPGDFEVRIGASSADIRLNGAVTVQ